MKIIASFFMIIASLVMIIPIFISEYNKFMKKRIESKANSIPDKLEIKNFIAPNGHKMESREIIDLSKRLKRMGYFKY